MSPQHARETLELLLGHLGLVFEVEVGDQAGRILLHVRTRDPGRLIGRDGQGLEDVQYLLNRILERQEPGTPVVIVDVENYRQQEKTDFLGHVHELADEVRGGGGPRVLPAMNSYDRRLVHQAFVDDPDIVTQSEDSSARLKRITLLPRPKAA